MPVMFLPQKCFPLKSNRKVSPHADTKLTCGLLLKEKTLPSLERVAIERAACTEPGVRGKSPDTSLNSSDMGRSTYWSHSMSIPNRCCKLASARNGQP